MLRECFVEDMDMLIKDLLSGTYSYVESEEEFYILRKELRDVHALDLNIFAVYVDDVTDTLVYEVYV